MNVYLDNDAFVECDGELKWLFCVISGVLQGCPLSGSLFVIVIDPLLFLFKRKVEVERCGRAPTILEPPQSGWLRLAFVNERSHVSSESLG